MAFSYDPTTPIGRVRLLIPDTKPDAYVFDDDELSAFLGLEGHVKRAAALSLETIASNEAMVLKVIRLLDIQTDGAKTADALLKRAALLRDQAEDDEFAVNAAFDVAELVYDDFTYRERLQKQAFRTGV